MGSSSTAGLPHSLIIPSHRHPRNVSGPYTNFLAANFHLDQIREAYSKLGHEQLVLFLSVRSLSAAGSDEEMAGRLAQYDAQVYALPGSLSSDGVNGVRSVLKGNPRRMLDFEEKDDHAASSSTSCATNASVLSAGPASSRPRVSQTPARLPDLPIEILALILDHLGDWELSQAVGLPTSLPRPQEWINASPSDYAILRGLLPLIRSVSLTTHPPTRLSAHLIIRFDYIHVLDYLLTHHRVLFDTMFEHDRIPVLASHHARVGMLSWWKHLLSPSIPHNSNTSTISNTPSTSPPSPPLLLPASLSIAEAIDGACRTGALPSLNWWLHHSGPLLRPHIEYTESSLEAASSKNHIQILDWFLDSGLPLKIGRSMDIASSAGNVQVLEWFRNSGLDVKYDKTAMHHASLHGRVDVLQWWLDSGLQLIFDADALTLASKYNRPEVLEWWDHSGLPIMYRMCDIEEALEDAMGGGEAAREWWKRKGVDFNANDTEWMKLQPLNLS